MAEARAERDVFTAVYRDMAEREVVGWQNHGKPLLAGDGRDWLQEAYEEALDMVVYLKARLMERQLFIRPGQELTAEMAAELERVAEEEWFKQTAYPPSLLLKLSVVPQNTAPERPWWRFWR